jgi:hypothetical protein
MGCRGLKGGETGGYGSLEGYAVWYQRAVGRLGSGACPGRGIRNKNAEGYCGSFGERGGLSRGIAKEG